MAVAERLGAAPAETLYVGDSETDVATARAAGVTVMLVNHGYTLRHAAQLGADGVLVLQPVAEAVVDRFQHIERIDVGILRRGPHHEGAVVGGDDEDALGGRCRAGEDGSPDDPGQPFVEQVLLALAGAAFVMKPEELRRDPILEAQGLIGMAPKYEVMYARCAEGHNNQSRDSAYAGGFSHQFPAHDDEDAAAFVVKARPQCVIASLYRLEPRRREKEKENTKTISRYRRMRVDV